MTVQPSPRAEESSQSTPRPRRGWWLRIGLSLALILLIGLGFEIQRGQFLGVAILPETGPDGPTRLVAWLPALGAREGFIEDPIAARSISQSLNLPEFPDISKIDADGQQYFYDIMRMVRDRPEDADRIGLLGQLYEAQTMAEKAASCYRRAILLAPDSAKWHYLLGLYHQKDGANEEAESYLARSAELDPVYAPVWMQRGLLAYVRGKKSEALGYLDRYVSLRPEDPLGYIERARLKLADANLEGALHDMRKAEDAGPIGRQGHRVLAMLHTRRGETQDAEFHNQMVAAEVPELRLDDPHALAIGQLETFRTPGITRLDTAFRNGLYETALGHQEQALDESHDQPVSEQSRIYGQISECYRLTGDYPEAVIHAEKALELNPDSAMAHTTLALCAMDSGKIDRAIEYADRAIQLDEESHAGRYARGAARVRLALMQAQLPEEVRRVIPKELVQQAVNDLERAVSQRPMETAYLAELGRAYGLLDRYEKAEPLLRKALRIAPGERLIEGWLDRVAQRESFWPQR